MNINLRILVGTILKYYNLQKLSRHVSSFAVINKKRKANKKFVKDNALLFGSKLKLDVNNHDEVDGHNESKQKNAEEDSKIFNKKNNQKKNMISSNSNFDSAPQTDISFTSSCSKITSDLAHYLKNNLQIEVDAPKSSIPNTKELINQIHLYPLSGNCPNMSLLNLPQPYRNKWPSVTKILDKTRPPEAQFYLDRWKMNMIEELGEDGFNKMQFKTLERGTKLHECIENYLLKKEISTEEISKCSMLWKSANYVLDKFSNVLRTESFFTHSELLYTGKMDCIAQYQNEYYVIDWKTSEKPKKNLKDTWDAPIQIAAYLGAINANDLVSEKLQGAIVIFYTNGDPADVHLMNDTECKHYWIKWLKRLQLYWDCNLDS